MAARQENDIGQEHALFYEAHATYLELRGSYAKATAAFEAGLERSDAPVTCSCLSCTMDGLWRQYMRMITAQSLHCCDVPYSSVVVSSSELQERTVKEHCRMQVRASCSAATSQVPGVSGPDGAIEVFAYSRRTRLMTSLQTPCADWIVWRCLGWSTALANSANGTKHRVCSVHCRPSAHHAHVQVLRKQREEQAGVSHALEDSSPPAPARAALGAVRGRLSRGARASQRQAGSAALGATGARLSTSRPAAGGGNSTGLDIFVDEEFGTPLPSTAL